MAGGRLDHTKTIANLNLDDDDDDNDDNDDEADASRTSHAMLSMESTTTSEGNNNAMTEKNKKVANKMGKTTKRVEKQEMIEREQRAMVSECIVSQ